jgi:hypothetical protein
MFYYTDNGVMYTGWYANISTYYGNVYGPKYFDLPAASFDGTNAVWTDFVGYYYY